MRRTLTFLGHTTAAGAFAYLLFLATTAVVVWGLPRLKTDDTGR